MLRSLMESCREKETGETGCRGTTGREKQQIKARWYDRIPAQPRAFPRPGSRSANGVGPSGLWPAAPAQLRWRARSSHSRASGVTASRSVASFLALSLDPGPWGSASPRPPAGERMRRRLQARRSPKPPVTARTKATTAKQQAVAGRTATPALGSRGITTGTRGQPALLPQLSDLFWLRGQVRFFSVFKVFIR